MNAAQHKAEAEALILKMKQDQAPIWSDTTKNYILWAQVHATLATIPDEPQNPDRWSGPVERPRRANTGPL